MIRFPKSGESMKAGDILWTDESGYATLNSKRPGRRAKLARYIMRFGLSRFLYRFGYYTSPVGVFMGPWHDEDIEKVLVRGQITIKRPPGWFE